MRFQGIQILRFFCATSVVVFHAVALVHERLAPTWSVIPWDHFANFGVLFFFAISGFVLTQALQKETVARYLTLRVLRIYPPFLFAVLIVALFRLAYGLPVGRPESLWGYLLLIPDGKGPAGFTLGGIEWTLKHEAFYYILLGILWSLRREYVAKVFFAGWALTILAYTIYSPGVATGSFPAPRYFLFSATHLPFIAGVYAYLYRDRVKIGWGALGFALTTLLGGYEFFLHTEAKYFCIAIAAFLALCKISNASINESSRVNSTLIRFGDGSYGLYLVHLAVQALLVENLAYQQYPALFALIMLLITSLAIGLTYGYFESGWYRWARRKVTFGRIELATGRIAAQTES